MPQPVIRASVYLMGEEKAALVKDEYATFHYEPITKEPSHSTLVGGADGV